MIEEKEANVISIQFTPEIQFQTVESVFQDSILCSSFKQNGNVIVNEMIYVYWRQVQDATFKDDICNCGIDEIQILSILYPLSSSTSISKMTDVGI